MRLLTITEASLVDDLVRQDCRSASRRDRRDSHRMIRGERARDYVTSHAVNWIRSNSSRTLFDPDDRALSWVQATSAVRGQRPPWDRTRSSAVTQEERADGDVSALDD